MLDNLVRKLELVSALSEPQVQAIRAMFTGSRRAPAGEDIVREGEAPASLALLTDGLACRYKSMPDGRRQILGFLIPGDLVDTHAFVMGAMDHSVGALTSCRLMLAPTQRVAETLDQHPRVARALWGDCMADAAVSREWLVGLGRRSAYSRIAHLLCEVVARMKAIGLTDGSVCDLPLTQQELADTLGLSLVHVNRVLQRLRASGLVSLGRGALQVHDWDGLQQAGEFDPAYLRPGEVRDQVQSPARERNFGRG
jgi:CRP-like cAMP-binding protein